MGKIDRRTTNYKQGVKDGREYEQNRMYIINTNSFVFKAPRRDPKLKKGLFII